MSNSHTLRVGFNALLASIILCCIGSQATRADDVPPNILLIVADDLGWADVGYHNQEIRTPYIDDLVATGVELDVHYVQPQCTPTRVALMTGRYPSRFGRHCTQAANVQAFPHGTPTMASMLQSAGYDTALTGKWHLGSKPEWGPNLYGFFHSHGSLAGAVGMYDHRYRLTVPEYTQTWHRNHEYIEQEGHATDLVGDEAVMWIEKERDGPFFLYVPFHSVHVPLVEEERWLERNAHIESADRRLFAAAVTHMDAVIGRMIDALEQTGQRDSTLIVFTSDNGGLNNHRGNTYPPPDPKLSNFSLNVPLRGQKGQMYEGGMRVPAFVNWPGRLEPRKVTAPLHVVDWMPTLANLVGAKLESDPPFDGRDIWPIVTGADAEPGPRTLYWVWGGGRQRVALRRGDWKIVRQGDQEEFELFNLAEDPYETTNLAEAMPEKLGELKILFEEEKSRDAL